MEEFEYELAFKLIYLAGEAKSKALMSIEKSKNQDFESAKTLLNEAKANLKEAHQLQTNLIHEEVNGNHAEMNILMVHAQDHLSMAMITIDRSCENLDLYQLICQIEKRLEEK